MNAFRETTGCYVSRFGRSHNTTFFTGRALHGRVWPILKGAMLAARRYCRTRSTRSRLAARRGNGTRHDPDGPARVGWLPAGRRFGDRGERPSRRVASRGRSLHKRYRRRREATSRAQSSRCAASSAAAPGAAPRTPRPARSARRQLGRRNRPSCRRRTGAGRRTGPCAHGTGVSLHSCPTRAITAAKSSMPSHRFWNRMFSFAAC